jgi:hypothetical protein
MNEFKDDNSDVTDMDKKLKRKLKQKRAFETDFENDPRTNRMKNVAVD